LSKSSDVIVIRTIEESGSFEGIICLIKPSVVLFNEFLRLIKPERITITIINEIILVKRNLFFCKKLLSISKFVSGNYIEI
jgi:hypothetical protein